MMDATHIKVHPHAAGVKGGNEGMSCTKEGWIPNCTWRCLRDTGKIRVKRRWCGRLFAEALIVDTTVDKLLVNKAYDTDAISNLAVSSGMDAVIPPKANRKEQRPFDYYLYRYRHLVENRFLDFKRCRGMVTRYAKNWFHLRRQ